MSIFKQELQRRWAGRYRVEGKPKLQFFDLPADNEESILSKLQTDNAGKKISEFKIVHTYE